MAKAMQPQKMRFSQAIQTPLYKNLVNNTLGDPVRAGRFIANITSAVAVNAELQKCDPGTILAGALLGESLFLQPSPQLGQFYLVPFKSKAKYDREGRLVEPEKLKAQFVLGYRGYIQLALRTNAFISGGRPVSTRTAAQKPISQITNNKSINVKQENKQQYTFQVTERAAADRLSTTVRSQETQSTDELARALNYGR